MLQRTLLLPNKTLAMESTDLGTPGFSSSLNFDGVQRQAPNDRGLPFRHALSAYFLSEIDTTWSDLPLIGCGYVSGLIDALSYNAWGNFSNMHTGRGQSMYFLKSEH